MEKAYADAVVRLGVSENASELTANLIAHLKRRGRMKLLPGILRELKAREHRAHTLNPVLEVAHEKDTAAAERVLKELGIDPARTKVNNALIKGWRVRSAGTTVDRSGKGALVALYRRITT